MKNFVLGTDEVVKLPEFEDIKEYVDTHDTDNDEAMYDFAEAFDLDVTDINDEDYDAFEEELDDIFETFRKLCANKSLEEILAHLDPEEEDYKVIERHLYKF